jgi:hypothetical protein
LIHHAGSYGAIQFVEQVQTHGGEAQESLEPCLLASCPTSLDDKDRLRGLVLNLECETSDWNVNHYVCNYKRSWYSLMQRLQDMCRRLEDQRDVVTTTAGTVNPKPNTFAFHLLLNIE